MTTKKVLLVATRNKGKAREFTDLLGARWTVETLLDHPAVPDVVEDGKTFEENAARKACEISRIFGGWALADDSGIEVDFLLGAPGVYSARYAGEPADDQRNNEKLLAALAGVPEERRGAHYRCVLVLANQGKVVASCEGICFGHLLTEARGTGGFGYDPFFVPDGAKQTFGELPLAEKQKISHRAKALRALTERLSAMD